MSKEAAWTIVGVIGIIAIYFIATLLYNNGHNNTVKTQTIRLAKLEACRTIVDEALRTLCIVEGGMKSDK